MSSKKDIFSFSIGEKLFVSNDAETILTHIKKFHDIGIFMSEENDESLASENVYRVNNCEELMSFIKFFQSHKAIFLKNI